MIKWHADSIIWINICRLTLRKLNVSAQGGILMKKYSKGFIMGLLVATLLMNVALGETIKKTIEVVYNSVNLSVNDKKVDVDNILYNGTTYVPIRAVAEMLGKEVGWDQATFTASINDKKVEEANEEETKKEDPKKEEPKTESKPELKSAEFPIFDSNPDFKVPSNPPSGSTLIDNTDGPARIDHAYKYSKSLSDGGRIDNVYVAYMKNSTNVEVTVRGVYGDGESFMVSIDTSNMNSMSYDYYGGEKRYLTSAQEQEVRNIMLAFYKAYGR